MTINLSKFGFIIRRKYSSVKDFYTKNHEWIKLLPNEDSKIETKNIFRARIGITDYSQKALGDIVFIEMPKIETKYNAEGMQMISKNLIFKLLRPYSCRRKRKRCQ